jgi:hypothetical protein
MKDIRRLRKRIEFEFEGCGGDVVINIKQNGEISQISGADGYKIVSNAELDVSATVNRRIKIYKMILLTVCFGILATVFALLILGAIIN